MKIIAAVCMIILLLAPFVFATHDLNQTKQSPSKKREFKGLQGIAGVSVEPEQKYGPQKPFGKPAPKRLKGLAALPPGYRGLAGIAPESMTAGRAPCAGFSCKPHQYVVGDTSTKTYYRCYCPAAKGIAPGNIKCIDTPAIADKIGYRAGTC
jgi:hypothetical protein